MADDTPMTASAARLVVARDGVQYLARMSCVAVQMTASFSVDTTHGVVSGEAGDYLMSGIQDALVVVPKEEFERAWEAN